MTLSTFRLVIETAQNGFLVYVNQDFSVGAVRPIPYVFESMKNLLEFVELNFHDKKSPSERFEDTIKHREESLLKF